MTVRRFSTVVTPITDLAASPAQATSESLGTSPDSTTISPSAITEISVVSTKVA
ncbi:hypothetical protein D3C72_2384700 [compost metagenome]